MAWFVQAAAPAAGGPDTEALLRRLRDAEAALDRSEAALEQERRKREQAEGLFGVFVFDFGVLSSATRSFHGDYKIGGGVRRCCRPRRLHSRGALVRRCVRARAMSRMRACSAAVARAGLWRCVPR